jgi:LuxR family maltose regulon positive regulatory protein
VSALETRTEGWIAGLQLAALSMRGLERSSDITGFINGLTGSHRYILDYLADEVLRKRPPGTKDFLLQTSILNRLNSSLCDAVLGRGAAEQGGNEGELPSFTPLPLDSPAFSQDTLEALEAANLFIIPLDNERRWYRYHHLFADLLRARLRQSRPDLVSELHRRASMWFEHNNLISEAIAHSLAVEDFERAAQLTEQTFFDRMSHGEDFATMLARLVALPDEIIRARPRLGIMYAWMLAITLQLDAVEPRLQDIERMAVDQLRVDLQRQITEIRAELARHQGEFAKAIELSHQVLEALPEERSITDMQTLTGSVFNLAWGYLQAGDVVTAQRWFSEALTISQAAGSIHLVLLTQRGLAQIYELRGQLRRANETYQQAIQIAAEAVQQSGQPVPATVYIQLGLGNLSREWNELDEADSLLTQGLEMGREWQIGGDTLRDGYLYQAQLKRAQGDMTGALDAIRQAQELALAYQSVPGFNDPIAACQAELTLTQAVVTGNSNYLETVEQWAESGGLQVNGSIDSLNDEFEYLVWARLLIAQNKLTPAAQLLARLLQAAEAGGRKGRVIEIWLLQALVQQAFGDIEQALTTIEHALSRAEPEGYIRLFVNESKPMEELLRRMKDKGGRVNEYVSQLLNVFREAKKIHPPSLRPGSGQVFIAQPLVDPLSERELEVLRLLGTDLSGPEIATELAVSVNTVKTHIKNIFSKLDAHSRYEAIERAKQLDLL